MDQSIKLKYTIYSIITLVATYCIHKCYKLQQFICHESYLFKPDTPKRDYWILVRHLRDCVKGVNTLMTRKPQPYSIVGMDCEMSTMSTPSKYPDPAILQLANPDGYCAIFQLKVMEDDQQENDGPLSKFKPTPFQVLEQVLLDSTILKVGVAVMNDALYMKERYGLMTKGCLDIRYLAEQVGEEPKGLDFLAKKVLGREKKTLRKTSPWESYSLYNKQCEYAVEDARLGIDIFLELNKREINKRYSVLKRIFWDEKTYWKHTIKLWEKYIGKHFVLKEKDSLKVENDYAWFENICNFSPICLFTIYESSIGQRRRILRCVKCQIDSLTRPVTLKATVPEDYNITSVDGIPDYLCLCERCCKIHQQFSFELRQELTLKCGAPFPEYEDNQLVRAKKIIKEIRERKESYEISLKKFHVCDLLGLPRRHLTSQTMEAIMNMDCRPGSAHGEHVHQYFKRFDICGVQRLSWIWYNRFLATIPVHHGRIRRKHL